MLSDTPLPIIDLPSWEPVHNPNLATIATSSWVTDGKNSIYYLNGAQLHKYDCDTDGWTRLADGLNAGTTTKSIVYTKWGGHFGKALSGTSNTISGAFGRGKSIIGKEIRIIGGTGIGQVRTITGVSEPVVGDFTIGTGNGEAITDTNKVYTKAQWIGYQVRIISGTGAGQTRPITTSCTSNNTIYVGDTAWVKAYFPQSSYSATSGAGTGSVFVIEYVTCTVDTNWDIPPDSSSLFEIASGAIWSLEYISSTVSPYCALHKYDVLFDYWEIKRPPIDYIPGGLTTDWHLETTQSDTKLEIGTADSGSLTTLVDNSKSFGANKYTNCRVFITKGTGIGQQRTILSNDSTSITVCKPFTISPSSDSEYYITHDVDKIWFYCIKYGGLLQYSIEFDEWSCGNIRDYGLLGEMTFVTDGGKVCTDFQSFSVSNNTASINTNFATDVASGDYITVYGASQSQLNGRHQINYSNSFSANPYTVSSANLTATPITYMGQTYYSQVVLSGTLSPNATGVYTLKGIYNNKPYYQRGNDNYFLFWQQEGAKCWVIAAILGERGTNCWYYISTTSIVATYSPDAGTYTGSPTVTNITTQQTYYNTVTVSGTLTPDATGVYTCKGLYKGAPYYQRGEDSFYIWYWQNIVGNFWWLITTTLGNLTPRWELFTPSALSTLTYSGSYNGASGTPTITNITADITYYNQLTVTSGYYNQVQVTGSMTPDVTGIYTYTGMVNNAPRYALGGNQIQFNSGDNRYYILQGGMGWYAHEYNTVTPVTWTPFSGATGSPVLTNVTASGIQPNTSYPDCEGIYDMVGIYNCIPYYQRGSDARYLYRHANGFVYMNATFPTLSGTNWYNINQPVNGTKPFDGVYQYNDAGYGSNPIVTNNVASGIALTVPAIYSTIPIINTNATLVDCTKNWVPNEHAGRVLSIPGISPYKHYITSNTETTLTTPTIITDVSNYNGQKYVIMDLKAFGAMEEDHNISYYSNYYKQIRVSGIYYNQVEVTGSLTPDATGVYTYAGMYNNRPYYQRGSENYFIWWNSAGSYWYVTTILGVVSTYRWAPGPINTTVDYTYSPYGSSTGTATVTNVLSSGLIENVTVTPNVEGVYTAEGIFSGKPYYKNGDWYLYKYAVDPDWGLSQILGLESGDSQYRWSINVVGFPVTVSTWNNSTSSGIVKLQPVESEGRYLDIPHSSGYGYSGITTGNNTLTLQDTTKNWMINRLAGKKLRTLPVGSTGLRAINTNTKDMITHDYLVSANYFNNIMYNIFSTMNAGTGVKLIWVYNCSDPLIGFKYIYRVKGANLIPCMDRFNLETETWEEFNLYPNSEQFTTGTMAVYDGENRIYIHHNNTGRIVYLDVRTNELIPFSQVPFSNSIGASCLGNRMVIMKSSDGSKYLYLTRNIVNNYEIYRLLLPSYQ